MHCMHEGGMARLTTDGSRDEIADALPGEQSAAGSIEELIEEFRRMREESRTFGPQTDSGVIQAQMRAERTEWQAQLGRGSAKAGRPRNL